MRLGPFELLLSSEYGIEEYQIAIDARVEKRGKPGEFVFCGYGEPTTRIRLLLELSEWIRDTYGVPIRLNTNGTTGLIHGAGLLGELASVVDRVNVSLNAPDEESYDRICRPRTGSGTFSHVIGFARLMKLYGVDLWCSAVNQVLSAEELSALRELLRFLNIPLRLR